MREPEIEGSGRAAEALSDAALVQLVLGDSSDALAVLYRRHAPMVYAVAFRFLASEHDAQDVLHDVFVGLPEALRKYRERKRFPYWLKRVAVRTSLMFLRSRGRRREDSLTTLAGMAAGSAKSLGRVPEYVALRRAVADLPDEQRAVLMLKQVEGYSHAEIGHLLGISEGASAARLHRAMRKLWVALADGER